MQHILLVDDNLTSLKQAAALLKDHYKVSMVKSGKQALEFLEKFTPNLILLDIEMPEMDGFETISRIKNDERFKKIPVIFLTGNHDTATEMKGFEYGAVDFITKPFSQEVMFHRINLQIELFEYQVQLESVIEERTEELLVAKAEKARITAELDVATKIQASMLPKNFEDFSNEGRLSICASMSPAREVGGDFYDFFKIDDDHVAFAIADVSGKGVPAALFMVIAKTLIKTKARNDLSPAKVLQEVNMEISETNEEDMFVTLFLGVLELSTGKFRCANAGHNPPIRIYPDGRVEYLELEKNFVLAGIQGMEFLENEFQLSPGERFLMYTDGVTEAMNERQEFFGEEQLIESIQSERAKGLRVEGLLKYLGGRVKDFSAREEQADDITMLVFQYM
ncbi:MAG: SpoIIE family protein phosphatase [Lachnospiraceae bacterium]